MKGPLRVLRSAPAQPAVAINRYARAHQGPRVHQQALLAPNVHVVEEMQDDALATIRNQTALTPGRHGIPFLSRL